jgi:hypothetical protein
VLTAVVWTQFVAVVVLGGIFLLAFPGWALYIAGHREEKRSLTLPRKGGAAGGKVQKMKKNMTITLKGIDSMKK